MLCTTQLVLLLKKKKKKNCPVKAIHGVTLEIRSTHQVPIEIGSAQRKALVIPWLLGASRKHPPIPPSPKKNA